jgi:hypothetical protein
MNTFFKIFIIVLLFISSKINCQIDDNAQYQFAISLQPNNQDIITFALISLNSKGEVVDRIFLKREDWIRQIIGIQQSKANPEGRNILKEAGLSGTEVINDLWKLRYSEWPYHGGNEKGWASKPRIPSEEQMKMLNKFGLYTINDYIYGKKLIELLKSLEDPAWVSEYQNK